MPLPLTPSCQGEGKLVKPAHYKVYAGYDTSPLGTANFFGRQLRETFKPLFLGTDYSIFQTASGEIIYSLTGRLEKPDQGKYVA
jgi:hypothetical protein